MSSTLPPLIRLAVNHHDPFMVSLRERLIRELIGKIQKVLKEDSGIRATFQSLGITSLTVGGSASLNTPRHPQDIDLYLDGEYPLDDKENSAGRLRIVRLLLEHAAEKLNAKVDHVYVRDEASKAPGLQRIGLQAIFEPHAMTGNSMVAAINHPIHMPLKIEVHHEREKLFLPPIVTEGRAGNHSFLRTVDPRMVCLQKFNRLFNPSDTLKGTDILDIAYMLDTGQFDPADPLMRKLGIAAMTSDGLLRNLVSMDFLIPRNREEEIAILKQDLEVNISRELLTQYSDDQLAAMIEKLRQAVRTLYPVKVADEKLGNPIFFEDAVALSEGEKQFVAGIFKGKLLGAGSARALIQAGSLFDNMNPPPEYIANRISHDAGILAEVEKTNQIARDDTTRRIG